MEPIINSQAPEFKVQAYHNGSFKTVSSDDIKGKFSFSTRLTLHLFVRPSW